MIEGRDNRCGFGQDAEKGVSGVETMSIRVREVKAKSIDLTPQSCA